jgi:ABC-type transporter Mla MlaB component
MGMLRVCYSENGSGQRWHLFGDLSGPWVDELRSCWSHSRRAAPLSRAVVDLSDVTFIDEAGEALLADMRRDGAEFVAAGVENKNLLASLEEKGKRPLRRRIEHLRQSCGEIISTRGEEQ